MAHRLELLRSFDNMPFIWNISSTVGTQTSESNGTSDVRLIKVLLNLIFESRPPRLMHPSLCAAPPLTDQMDHITAFWIYYLQFETRDHRVATPGAIQPASQGAISWNSEIVRLNSLAAQNNFAKWERLPQHNGCSEWLRSELTSVMFTAPMR